MCPNGALQCEECDPNFPDIVFVLGKGTWYKWVCQSEFFGCQVGLSTRDGFYFVRLEHERHGLAILAL